MEHIGGYCCLAGMLGFASLLLVSLWWKPEPGPPYWERHDDQESDDDHT